MRCFSIALSLKVASVPKSAPISSRRALAPTSTSRLPPGQFHHRIADRMQRPDHARADRDEAAGGQSQRRDQQTELNQQGLQRRVAQLGRTVARRVERRDRDLQQFADRRKRALHPHRNRQLGLFAGDELTDRFIAQLGEAGGEIGRIRVSDGLREARRQRRAAIDRFEQCPGRVYLRHFLRVGDRRFRRQLAGHETDRQHRRAVAGGVPHAPRDVFRGEQRIEHRIMPLHRLGQIGAKLVQHIDEIAGCSIEIRGEIGTAGTLRLRHRRQRLIVKPIQRGGGAAKLIELFVQFASIGNRKSRDGRTHFLCARRAMIDDLLTVIGRDRIVVLQPAPGERLIDAEIVQRLENRSRGFAQDGVAAGSLKAAIGIPGAETKGDDDGARHKRDDGFQQEINRTTIEHRSPHTRAAIGAKKSPRGRAKGSAANCRSGIIPGDGERRHPTKVG